MLDPNIGQMQVLLLHVSNSVWFSLLYDIPYGLGVYCQPVTVVNAQGSTVTVLVTVTLAQVEA
jgi:hypothetical protein